MDSPEPQPGPAALYQSALQQGVISADSAQELAVAALELRYRHLLQRQQQPAGLFAQLRRTLGFNAKATMPGLYLWGGVGRGKTFLMDLFFHALPPDRKMRMHFHRFMLMVHDKLGQLQGRSDPLIHVARSLALETDVLCFDEFFVSDIGDAMILANLLDALFRENVMLVTTSNILPDRLYERGLQRQRFLPAIDLLKQHTEVMNVDGGIDYRLRSMDKASVYFCPLDASSTTRAEQLFADLTRGLHVASDKTLEIAGRHLTASRWAEGICWFTFAMLCRGPRGAADYVELARQYHTIFISDIPCFPEEGADDEIRRFITLVDEFYDHGVKLILTAATGLLELYQGRELRFSFERTVSRLQEMQTRDYLAAPHRPD